MKNKIKYLYLQYPLDDKNISSEELFSKGLPLKSKSLELMKHTITDEEEKFNDWLLKCSLLKSFAKKICIVKIPLPYLGRSQSKIEYIPCMPLLYTHFDFVNGETNYLVPDMILGVYDTMTNNWLENETYDLEFNPRGLQFADEQLDKMKVFAPKPILDYAMFRRNFTTPVLYEQDKLTGAFDSTIEYYENLFKQPGYVKQRKPEEK